MNQLDQLAQHRDAILLAEIGAWLHDDFKHTDQQIHNYVNHAPSPSGRQDTGDLIPDIELEFLGKRLKLILVKNRKKDDFVDGYLNRCHYTAHIEKEDGNSQQTYPAYLSTPFGVEVSQIPTDLTENLRNQVPWHLINNPITNRSNFQSQLQELFSQVGGDTRRPGNEITLWEWGHTVGALYKAALIGAYFQQQLGLPIADANDLRWQLLGVRTDALEYLTNVARLPDLEARKNTLQIAIENVKTLLEETYPLATEVYRDENGSLYVVPNFPNLLGLQSDGNQALTLQAHIQQQFNTDGEIIPQITLDPTAWWGQDPDRQGNDQIPPAGKLLASPAILQSDVAVISEAWQGKPQTICPICGLRSCVNKQLDYCQVCGERRKGRVAEWLQDQSKTIWLDEVADSNGRLALITGTFDLANWLDGSLVETLLVQEPTNGTAVSKNPSFARLRRIWQTTQTFWQETQTTAHQTLTDARRRLTLQLANQPRLTQYQVYELDLHGRSRMSVLWDGQHLISTDNLSYTAKQLGIKPEERKTPADSALVVGTWLDSNKQKVFQLISDDEKNKRFDIQIADVDYQDAEYATAIPILAQPRTFMALIPAGKAIDIVQAIQTKYEREMGKVRNRLPLHLGLVYFHRRTPLRAVLDAGRRMLKYEGRGTKDETWTVQDVRCLGRDKLPEALVNGTKQFDLTVAVTLKEQNGRSLTWHVPAVMGDGTTPDNWYPYVFIKSDKDGNTPPVNRIQTFTAPNPHTSTLIPHTLIHATELQADDEIYFTPATLDFQWLDSTARRFEIAYDENGRRRDHLTRPYLLDQLNELETAWGMLQNLSKNQLYALRDAIEQKRAEWFAEPQNSVDDNTFKQFCADVVRNTKWKTAVDHQKLTNWAINGLLADTIQLHVSIMKEKLQSPKEEQSHE